MTLPPVNDAAASDPRTHRADAAFRRYVHTGDPAAIADLFDLAAGDLHRTALHLVGDDATAHDLVQITFLVALERRGFDEQRQVLPWLAGILRNQAALVHRRRAQRLDRDRLRVEPSEDPAQRAAEHELAGEVESALERLPEMYRPVVRLHVLHGLDAGAIAVNLARPGGTVRTQLMRGLERLRALLPIGAVGVVAGLLPSTGTAAVRTTVLAAAGSGRHAAVAVLAKAQARPPFGLLAVAGVLALAMAAWWWGGDDMSPPTPSPTFVQHDAMPFVPVAPVVDALVPAAAPREAVVEVPATFELRGVVTGTVNGVADQPVAEVEVLLWPKDRPVMHGDTFTPAPAASTRTAADGTFTLQATGEQCYVLARAPGAISEYGVFGDLDRRTRVDGLAFRLQPVVEQRGVLLDAEGKPVPDFAFGSYRGGAYSADRMLRVPGFRRVELPHLDVRTDAHGAFAVQAAADAKYLWEVQHPRHAMLRLSHRAADGPVELRMERGSVLGGVVWLPNGAPAVGAEVEVADWPRRKAVCDAQGRWDVAGVAMRKDLWLSITHADAALFCTLVPKVSTTLETRLEAPHVLAGRLVDTAGHGLADRELRLVGDRELKTDFTYQEPCTWEFLLGRSRLRTGPDGAFRAEGLYASRFRIELKLADGSFVVLQEVRSGNDGLQLQYIDTTAVLRGKVLDATTGAPIEAGTLHVMRSDDGGSSWLGHSVPFTAPGGELTVAGIGSGLVRLDATVPGYAKLESAARTLESGEQRCDLMLYPIRELVVEAWSNGAPADGRVSVRTTDGQTVMLWVGGPSYGHLDLVNGWVRLDRMPARPIVVTLVRGGEENVERTIDLTTPPAEPLVFDLDGAGAPPVLRFGLLVRTSARDFDATRWQGPLDAAAMLDVERTAALALPVGEVVVTFQNDAGKVLATGRIKVRDGRYETWMNYPGGNGTGLTGPEATLDVRLRTHGVTLTTACEGFLPVTRKLLPHEIDANGAAFLLVLPAK